MSAKKPDPFILFSDSALSELEHDAFDLEKKLGVIRSAILNPKTETPFTVMVTGGWGSGKTSAMAWLQKDLEARAKKAADEEIRADTCWFYPWKYQNQEDVWRGLISEVILAAIDFDNVDAAKIVKAAKQFGSFLGRGFVRILSSVKISSKASNPTKTVDVGAELSLKEALGGVIEEYGKSVTPQEAYFNEFEAVLKRWVADSYPKNGNQRLVVFIDDLDRCLPKIALQVLEALKLYLNIPNLIFVVGVDRTVIDQIVTKSYCDMVGERAMEGRFKDKAAKYLDKMFQVEINVEPTDYELKTFFERKIEKSDAWEVVPEAIRQTIKLLFIDNQGGMSDRTPRTLVRQFNRLLAAAQRDSGEGDLSPAQAMQREMIDLICHEKTLGDDLPQRSRLGREFFKTWSEIIQANKVEILAGQLASYFPPEDHTKAESKGTDSETLNTSTHTSGIEVEARSMPTKTSEPNLNHLSPLKDAAFVRFSSLLTSAPLARLLEISYAVAKDEANSDLDVVRSWIATKRGVQPDRITDQEIFELTELDISELEISDLSPLCGMTNLRRLDCDGTQVFNLSPLAQLTNIEELYCDRTALVDLSTFPHLGKLRRFSCSHTSIKDLSPLIFSLELEAIYCRHTEVSDLASLSGFKRLKTLSCSGTKISDLSPLSKHQQLQKLFCSETQIFDLTPLSDLKQLQELHCRKTLVFDLSPLFELNNLEVLYCRGTKISKQDIAKFKKALPNCKVTSDFP